ncbi:hypothetical protein AB0H88_05815 [Nonomuraea sp. NPDC050680]|uniref:hypothetical protein n=1 Tax=Nonomuraea sp. NPDC050680 TaxID=3154630 RepID=UPI0033F18932
MAVPMTMVRMKAAVLRHSMTGQRAGLVVTGGVLGVALAGGTIVLALSAPSLLPAAYAVWMLGWTLGPMFAGGGDETLRPEYFTLLGLPPRRLAEGLLASAFVGVTPAVSLLALGGLVVEGGRHGAGAALVAVPAMVLQLAAFVLLSKVTVAMLGLVLRSRAGAVLAGVINGAVLAALGQGWVFAVAFGVDGGVPEFVRYLPSGWGVLAVQGDWVRAVVALAALALLVALLLAAWAALLTRRMSANRTPSARRTHRGRITRWPVVRKELKTWSRDLVRTHQITLALTYGLAFAAAPLILGWPGMLPWAGPIFIVMAAGMSANLYGSDGTALWLTIMTPGARDVRGRQLAWLLTVGPPAIALTLAFTAVAQGEWPLMLALLAALLGGGAGLVPLVSVYSLVPGTDPHRRAGNPLRSTEDEGAASGLVYAMLALCTLTAVPAGLVAWFAGWPGVAVGVVTGILYAWGFGLLAQRRLTAQGPELLNVMRTGRRTTTVKTTLPKREQIITAICWGFGAIPLIPQGVVPGIFKMTGVESRGWFLALYLPPWLQWPTIVFMALLGLTMYGLGLWLPLRHRKHS